MPVVLLPSMFREAAGGRERVEVAGATLKAAMADLVRRFPDLEERIFDESGDLQPHLGFFVDGVHARAGRDAHLKLAPDAEVVIVPALSGGAGSTIL